MKFEQLLTFFKLIYKTIRFYIDSFDFFIDKMLSKLFAWKTFNSSEYFWFIYSNKKVMHELRNLRK